MRKKPSLWLLSLILFIATASSYSRDGCDHVIVGGGWSGTYFAWRTTVDTNAYPISHTCIFEGRAVLSGKAYSKALDDSVPALAGIHVDLGAYRWDKYDMPLVDHVMREVLNETVRCYDPSKDPDVCNRYGNLNQLNDAWGNNKGFGFGPQGLARVFENHGGRVFLKYKLVNILKAETAGNNFRLKFVGPNGKPVFLECKTLLLNMPRIAIGCLEKVNNILYDDTTEEVRKALFFPTTPTVGAKQFLVYPSTPWRKYHGCTTGNIRNNTSIPQIKGRLHDFYRKSEGDWGVILTFYDFGESAKYYLKYRKDPAEPYNFYSFSNSNESIRDMISKASEAFKQQLKEKCGFDQAIPDPFGTVISVFYANQETCDGSTLLGAPTAMAPDFDNDATLSKDYQKLIDTVSKPLPAYPLFIANEAYSGGYGWAHPALVMTERIIWKYVSQQAPAWLSDISDCASGSSDNSDCGESPSKNWWLRNIAYPNPTQDTIYEPQRNITPSPCPLKLDTPDGYHLEWTWLDPQNIEITYSVKLPESSGASWIGFGISPDSMSEAEFLLIAFSNGTYQQRTPISYYEPEIVPVAKEIVQKVTITSTATQLEVKFQFKNATKVGQYNLTGPELVPVILSSYTTTSTQLPQSIPQHTNVVDDLKIPFSCGHVPETVLWSDLKFRLKDREFMLFYLDLFHCKDVADNYDEILKKLKEKTIYGLQGGMPPDRAWSYKQIQAFEVWGKHKICDSSAGYSGKTELK